MSSTGIKKYAAAHFKEHGYCSVAYNWGPEINGNQPVYSSFTTNQDNLSHSANFYLEQRATIFTQSRENCHFRSLSASESASYSPSRKRPRTAKRSDSQARSVSGSKECPPTISPAQEPYRRSRRLSMPKKTTSPLSSCCSNIPSTSSAFGSAQSKSRKSSDDKMSSGSKRTNFTKEQTGMLNRWLELNLEHPYPTEEEKFLLAERAGITLNQVNSYYINARRRSGYKKMCEEQGIAPIAKKKKNWSRNSNDNEEGEKENQVPVRGHSDLSSRGSKPASVRSSSSSPASSTKLEASSPEIEESHNHDFVADSGFNHVQSPPSQVPVFVKGSGFIPPPPLPSDVSPEVLAVSREVVEPVYINVPPEGSLFEALLSIAEKYPDADVKAYERNLPREYYIAEELMAENAVQSPPSQVPVFVKGSGFIPPPPLPSDVSPEVLAVSREVVEPVYINVPPEGSLIEALLSIAEKYPDADIKAYERNLPREYYIAEELKAENPGFYTCKKTWL